jgi:hypothetical protein
MDGISEIDVSQVKGLRHSSRVYEGRANAIANDPALHGRWLEIGRWDEADKNKAMTTRQSLTGIFGNDPSISGFEFAAVSNTEGTQRLLIVCYSPDLVVDGAWGYFQEAQEARKEAQKARDNARALEEAKAVKEPKKKEVAA